jgi:hypothetical protein
MAMKRRRRNPHHDNLMAGYYAAREAWEIQAEAVTMNYDAELAEYAAANPRPTFRDFLLHQDREREMA